MSRDYVLEPFRRESPLQIDYAKELNEQQHAAVTAPPGPALVIAGAGSGKTRTLTYRVAYLLENGVLPSNILLLTFTNKAAREMLDRVANLIPHDITGLWGGTFHSIGNRILRRHPQAAGFAPGFSIMDREDQKDMLDAVVTSLGVDPKEKRFPKGEVLGDVISYSLNTGKSIEDVLAEHYQRQFQFILVDEYQDTNHLQADFIDILAAHHRNVMVVGDDAQSIYSWRGADFKNILDFPKRYPQAKV